MTRSIIISLLLTLLSSTWAQAGVMMPIVENNAATTTELTLQSDLPPCHKAPVQELQLEQESPETSTACCDDNCSCEGFCQSASYLTPAFLPSASIRLHSDTVALISLDWSTVGPSSLYRPPIR